MGVKIKGAKELERKLERMAQNAKELEGMRSVPFDELFTRSFMSQNSKSLSIESFLGDLGITDQASLRAFPEDKLDEKVKADTSFNNWQEMLNAASSAYVKRQLDS
ncbi:hypothetical protein [Lacticaseibacillus salsurivasis]|uniref:hypothetical protein n=1 Tax=Lacticaseibacillus salsurivasis TaxID=3081441 RepID=UPI0030C6BCCE